MKIKMVESGLKYAICIFDAFIVFYSYASTDPYSLVFFWGVCFMIINFRNGK